MWKPEHGRAAVVQRHDGVHNSPIVEKTRWTSAASCPDRVNEVSQSISAVRSARPLRWRGLAVAGLALLILTAAGAVHAARLTERNKQKQAAEAERAALRQKLAALKRRRVTLPALRGRYLRCRMPGVRAGLFAPPTGGPGPSAGPSPHG